MADNTFFEEMREQSRVKASIVAKYFDAWAKVIVSSVKRYPRDSGGKVAYIDLFCGPGRYVDGSKSTPVLILEAAISNADLRERLVTIFNDRDKANCESLRKAIAELDGVNLLKHQPQVCTEEVGDQLAALFERLALVPTLFFVDPWGYKGVSLRLIASLIKDWGCDCIIFFNYNRIRMHLSNPATSENMDALFGRTRADKLRMTLDSLKPHEQQPVIIEEMCQALLNAGGRYVLPFRFMNEDGKRTSHHLILVSKHFRAYDIMKGIMARESSTDMFSIPSFEYNPATRQQPLLFGLFQPTEELGDSLRSHFAGRTLSVDDIYEEHSVGRPYVRANYKDALLKLESRGLVITSPPAAGRRKGTMADKVMVSFPPNGV